MPLEGRSIGLIEDDPIMGESLAHRLSLEGAKVLWWRGRAEALRGIAMTPVDAVVCDIRLGDGRGEDVFRDVGAIAEPPPFLFMTAFADIDEAVRLMKAGAGDYLTKPFEMTTLLQRLAAMLERARPAPPAADLRRARGEAERALIERTLIETGGRVGEAAKRLKVSRTTLWTRMKALGLSVGTDVQKTGRND